MFPKVHMFPDEIGWNALGIPDPSVLGKHAIITGDPKRVERIASRLEDAVKLGEVREHISYLGYKDNVKILVVSSGMGAPNAAFTVEGLALAGIKTIIRIGTAGGLQEYVNPGDIVIPTAAVRGDGVTHEYISYRFPAVADIDVIQSLITSAKKYNVQYHVGIIWSHDAIFMESEKRVTFWNSANVIATEMECSTVFTISYLRGVKAAAILAIDGNLIRKQQFGASKDILQNTIDIIIDITLDSIVRLSKSNK